MVIKKKLGFQLDDLVPPTCIMDGKAGSATSTEDSCIDSTVQPKATGFWGFLTLSFCKLDLKKGACHDQQ